MQWAHVNIASACLQARKLPLQFADVASVQCCPWQPLSSSSSRSRCHWSLTSASHHHQPASSQMTAPLASSDALHTAQHDQYIPLSSSSSICLLSEMSEFYLPVLRSESVQRGSLLHDDQWWWWSFRPVAFDGVIDCFSDLTWRAEVWRRRVRARLAICQPRVILQVRSPLFLTCVSDVAKFP